MNQKDLVRLLHAQPFEPFRFHLSDGTSFLVPHQDFGEATKTQLILSQPSETVPHGIIECAILHITRIERPPIIETPKHSEPTKPQTDPNKDPQVDHGNT